MTNPFSLTVPTMVIVGSPGCGKTAACLRFLNEELESGTPLERVGYSSFTKAAVEVAKTRAVGGLEMSPAAAAERMPYFRTLHSLAFKMCGMRRANVFGPQHRKEFGRLLGANLDGLVEDDGTVRVGAPIGGAAFFQAELARVTQDAAHAARLVDDDSVTPEAVAEVDRKYTEYKRTRGLFDFTDMLVMALAVEPPDLDCLFIDEAQDLTRLQWLFVRHVAQGCKRVYVAGDDKQAIFQWGGAAVDTFVKLPGQTLVLNQGYRMRPAVHNLAVSVGSRIKTSRKAPFKAFTADGRLGSVSRVRSLDDVPFNKGKGTWLVLARHRHIVEEAHRVAKEIGVLPKMRARVKFSTIHGSKGMGVDNVVIFPDMTRRTYNSMVDLDPDAEHRVAYVAASRARHTVYLLEQRGKYGYEY